MRAEREIAGFVLPFAVGIMAATLPIWPSFHDISWSFILLPATTLAPLILLIHPCHIRMSGKLTSCMILISALSCGMMTGLTSAMMHISNSTDSRLITDMAQQMCRSVQGTINGLPFRKPETSAVLNALLTGDRNGIPHHLTESFRESGASHILALSGLHLGIIYGIVNKALSILSNNLTAKRIRSAATLIICYIYTIATGAGASITRALIFIIASETAALTGRHRSIENTLYTALLIQLSLFPSDISSISFQLSYAAIAGITYIYPLLKNLWPEPGKRGILGFIWNSAAMSISCQITTGPLAWVYFRSFPVYFLLTNMIAVPLTALIIPFSLVTIILTAAGICPEIMTRATECLVQTLTAALDIISSM